MERKGGNEDQGGEEKTDRLRQRRRQKGKERKGSEGQKEMRKEKMSKGQQQGRGEIAEQTDRRRKDKKRETRMETWRTQSKRQRRRWRVCFHAASLDLRPVYKRDGEVIISYTRSYRRDRVASNDCIKFRGTLQFTHSHIQLITFGQTSKPASQLPSASIWIVSDECFSSINVESKRFPDTEIKARTQQWQIVGNKWPKRCFIKHRRSINSTIMMHLDPKSLAFGERGIMGLEPSTKINKYFQASFEAFGCPLSSNCESHIIYMFIISFMNEISMIVINIQLFPAI